MMKINVLRCVAGLVVGTLVPVVAIASAHSRVEASDPGLKNRGIVEPLAKRDKALYDSILDGATPIVIRRREEQGYAIESGRFRSKDGSIGSIIMVTSPDKDVTGMQDFPNKHETFRITSRGERSVTPFKATLQMERDFLPGVDNELQTTPNAKSQHNIQFLAAYTINSLEKINADPVAYALMQLETAAEGLANSKVSGVTLTLGAVGIFQPRSGEVLDTSSAGLRNWQDLLAPYRALYRTDMNMAIADLSPDAGGRAYIPGYTSSNGWSSPAAFRHELGHNVGGNHCNEGGSSNYRFGYNNGRSRTFLCGNSSPYYSTPDVSDDYGLALGDKDKADMARLWREQADRMANYNPELSGEKLIFVWDRHSPGKSKSKSATIKLTTPADLIGVVALTSEVGPTEVATLSSEGYTPLTVSLLGAKGYQITVKLRGTRAIATCGNGPMNRAIRCVDRGPLFFTLSFFPADNPALPDGVYNGLLRLKAKQDGVNPGEVFINIPISLVNVRW